MRCLLAAGADVHARNCYGSTPLHAAAVGSMRESAQLLLAAGAQLDAVNNGGWTPLQYAIRGGEGFCEPAFVAWLVRLPCSFASAHPATDCCSAYLRRCS